MKHYILIACAVLLGGCATPSESGERFDPPFAITPSDLNQAKWVENVCARTPDFEGKYRVVPSSSSIAVTFDVELTKEEEETVRENMKRMSADLARAFKKANKLIFRFKNVELVQ